ncbi:MAG: hypothetical protein CVV33_02455 [Methanomicrobiales archaeon HGW-Methanomicrobiales-4]|nr:MAG: hypothetical protein CVV33_02455 [Methanomicrobiales archaeon HGW-Methanomicrobiales-4]
MFPSISRSIDLIRASWSVLNKDKEIMLFPVLSGIACIIVVASFIIPSVLIGAGLKTIPGNQYLLYVGLFIFYLITYFIIIFFNVGLVTCANIRLNGGDPTFSDGISNALRNIHRILVWSLISATVGVILSLIRDQKNIVGQIISSLLGTAWALLTYFVIPVMILEEKGVVEAIKDSASLFKRTWGETVVGQGGIMLVFGIIAMLGMIPVVLSILSGYTPLIIAVIGLYLLLVVVLGVIGSALQGIFNTALYLYAKTGTIPSAFNAEQIEHAFRPTKKTGI